MRGTQAICTCSSRQKQVLPHWWHSSFSSEAETVTTDGIQAIAPGRNRCCFSDGELPVATLLVPSVQGRTNEYVRLAQLTNLMLQIRALKQSINQCYNSWRSNSRITAVARIATVVGAQALVQDSNRYCHTTGTQPSVNWICYIPAVFRIHDILVRILNLVLTYLLLTDPALFVINLQDGNQKKNFFLRFLAYYF